MSKNKDLNSDKHRVRQIESKTKRENLEVHKQ